MTMSELGELISEEIEEVEEQLKIKLDISNVLDSKINKLGFELGVSDVSKVCGEILALKSVGLDSSQALEYVLNKMTIEHNQKLNKENNDTLLESTRLQSIKVENAQL